MLCLLATLSAPAPLVDPGVEPRESLFEVDDQEVTELRPPVRDDVVGNHDSGAARPGAANPQTCCVDI